MANIEQKIENGDIEGVKDLIRKDPTIINKPIDGYGTTPLMLASQVGADRRIIDILIKAGPELGAKDVRGQTALHWAVLRNHLHAVEILLSRGSEVNPQNKDGRTPLHFACWLGHLHTVDLLLGHNGIDANVVDNDGDTPLHWAVRRRNYKVVCAMLSKDSVQLDIKNHQKVTPLQLAVSEGHIGMVHQLIAKGADVNVVNNDGNNCLHLAVKTKRFHSEVEPLSILDKFCKDLKLGNEERCSGVVVACYLAHHGANFYCKNKIGRTPLDLIEKENLKKTLNMLFSPTQCVFCEDEVATETFFPCKHLSLCKKCCPPKIPKRCLKCGRNITSKNSLEGPMSSKPEVQMLAEPPVNRTFEDKEMQTLAEPVVNRTFEVKETQTLAEPVVNRTFEVKETQTLAEPVVNRTFEVKETQTLTEPVVNRTFEVKETQTLAEPVEAPTHGKFSKVSEPTSSTTKPVECPVLDEKFLQDVAQNLGGKWQQVGRELGIKTVRLEIIKNDNPLDTVEQSFQMLRRWFTTCDPETRTHRTLREALVKCECFDALEYLPQTM